MTRPLTNAEKIAKAKARMAALGIEPITTRVWKKSVDYIAPKHVQLASVTKLPARKRP